MRHSRKELCVAFVVGAVLATLAGCDETRFVGVKTQVDTFTQEGQPVTDYFTQEGTQQVDTFDQTGFTQVDTFQQKASGQVDILWVVDNSASMLQEQTNLGNNFDNFIAFIDESLIDYHIGVISTDMDQASHSGKLQGSPAVIDRDTPDPQDAFAANVQVGTDGGGNEMGLVAAHAALTEPLVSGANAGFLREGASLAIIFVSDEDDKSYGEIGFYQRFFSAIKGVGNENDVILAAIVGDEPDGCSGANGTAAYGERFHELVEALGGTTASICSSDFGSTLQQLGLTVAGLNRIFVLSREPDPASVVVSVDEGAGWTEIPNFNNQGESNWDLHLETLELVFNAYIPPPGADIQVEYSNVEDIFYLSALGDPSTLVVTVDGTEIEQTDACWQYHAGQNAIVFYGDCIPPLGSTVEVSYSDLMRAFPLSTEVENPDTLKVEEDPHDGLGWRTIYEDPASGWIYHAETNSIRFQGSHVPALGADVRVSYSNLLWLFPLSLVPQVETLIVTIDPDGEGPTEAERVLPYDASASPEGWIYYGPDEAGEFANSISFEKAPAPPVFGSVITATYNPSSQ